MPEKDEVRQAAGDRLLPSSGARWAANVRVVDLLAGIRGGEFGLLLPGSTGDDGLETLRRLNAATHKLRSFSAGLAEWVPEETGAEVSPVPTVTNALEEHGAPRELARDSLPRR